MKVESLEKCGLRGRLMPTPYGPSNQHCETWCGLYVANDSVRLTTVPKEVTCPHCVQVIDEKQT